jgi:hypothetical protein
MRHFRNIQRYGNFYIYCIYGDLRETDIGHEVYYIGQRLCPKKYEINNDPYMGTSTRLNGFIRKEFERIETNGVKTLVKKTKIKGLFEIYGKDKFQKIILNYSDNQLQTNDLETKRIKEYRELYGTHLLNFCENGIGAGFVGKNHPNFGRRWSLTEEQKENQRGKNNAHYGKKWYTDGKINKRGFECPIGFKEGFTSKIDYKKRKQIDYSNPTEKQLNGWKNTSKNMKGNKNSVGKNTGKTFFTNGIEIRLFKEGEQLEGYWKDTSCCKNKVNLKIKGGDAIC